MNEKEQPSYRSWVEVDLDHFHRNWREMRRLVGPDVKIMQVVKADAYGHGAIEISHMALRNGAAMLGVANADEGIQLRVSGITAPVLILSPSTVEEIPEIIKYGLEPSVSDPSFAAVLDKQCRRAKRRIPVHIEVDTGMGRGGTLYPEALKMVETLLAYETLQIEGIFTHLSMSEVLSDYNELQWLRFRDLLSRLSKRGIRLSLRHMSNSGAILNYPSFHLDMVRPGLMSYGIYPSPALEDKARLWPVMSFKTRIVLIKDYPSGYGIGYNRTFVTEKSTRIATIPIGYGDGYGFILSNRGEVLVKGRRAPIVGRISMDMATLDVSGLPDCRVGDEVVLLGRQGKECITANEIAERVHSISYEILCALGKRAPRVFVHKGKTGAVEPRLRRIFVPGEERSLSRIDSIIRYCFQARARNEQIGDAIYYEMFETLFGKEDRQLELRTGFRYRITVADVGDAGRRQDPGAGKYYRVATQIRYVKTLRDPVFMIGCAQNNEQLAALFEDKQCEYRWLLNQGKQPLTEKDFSVTGVRIDGEAIPIVRAENTERGFEVWCGHEGLRQKLDRPVTFEIDIETKKSKDNHFFSVYLVYPTQGLDILFDYQGTAFKNVREISFFAGKNPYPEVVRHRGKCIRLKIGEPEWIFPNSGVTFVWDE